MPQTLAIKCKLAALNVICQCNPGQYKEWGAIGRPTGVWGWSAGVLVLGGAKRSSDLPPPSFLVYWAINSLTPNVARMLPRKLRNTVRRLLDVVGSSQPAPLRNQRVGLKVRVPVQVLPDAISN